MEVSYIRLVGPEYITGALRATTGKDMYKVSLPKPETWERLVRSAHGVPHSPLRVVQYRFYIEDIPSWVTVHFVRHHVGVQFYIKSQRDDRNKSDTPRSKKPQGELINMMFDINANSLINMAKARLCNQAAKETRQVMNVIKACLLASGDQYDNILGEYMLKPCDIGDCFEPYPCKRD